MDRRISVFLKHIYRYKHVLKRFTYGHVSCVGVQNLLSGTGTPRTNKSKIDAFFFFEGRFALFCGVNDNNLGETTTP